MTSCNVRRYESGDREDVLSLFAALDWPRAREEQSLSEWFNWRFHDYPRTSSVPLSIAENGHSIIGVRAGHPMELSVDGEPVQAILQGESLVHPDHRREGVFTQLLDFDHEYYRQSGFDISYGAPNDKSLSALLKRSDRFPIDRGIVTDIPKYYRIHDPSPFLGSTLSRLPVVRQIAKASARALCATIERFHRLSEDISVKYHNHVPVDTLANLYRENVPRLAHAVRDEQFYRWRVENPLYKYSTYTSGIDDEPIAAITIETPRRVSGKVSRVIDAMPLTTPSKDGRGQYDALARGVREQRDSNAILALEPTLKRDILTACAFFSSSSFPLSRLTKPAKFIAWPTNNGNSGWVVNGHDLCDPDNWQLSWLDISL